MEILSLFEWSFLYALAVLFENSKYTCCKSSVVTLEKVPFQ